MRLEHTTRHASFSGTRLTPTARAGAGCTSGNYKPVESLVAAFGSKVAGGTWNVTAVGGEGGDDW
jgi:hypothetical protein